MAVGEVVMAFDFSRLRQGFLFDLGDIEEGETDDPPAAEEDTVLESGLVLSGELEEIERLKQSLGLPAGWSQQDWDLPKGVSWEGSFLVDSELSQIRKVFGSENGNGGYPKNDLRIYGFVSGVEVYRWTKNVLLTFGVKGYVLILLGCNGYIFKDRDGPESTAVISLEQHYAEAIAAG